MLLVLRGKDTTSSFRPMPSVSLIDEDKGMRRMRKDTMMKMIFMWMWRMNKDRLLRKN